MSTTETYLPTNFGSDPIRGTSAGTQHPHPTTPARDDPKGLPLGGDPATQTAMDRSNANGWALSGSILPHPTTPTADAKGLPSGGDPSSVTDHIWVDDHKENVGHGSTSTASHSGGDAQNGTAGRGSTSALDQSPNASQMALVDGGSNSQQVIAVAKTKQHSPAGADAEPDRTATVLTNAIGVALFDPALAFAADILDDTEGLWVANSNRLRVLTTPADKADADGVCRGFGLTEAHDDVARLAAMVATLEQLTKDATKHLEKVMRRHPLHPWVKAQKGLGDKQTARLLAAIGDPYWNTLHDRPRTVSELWSYCGLGDAAKQVRRRGQKANWSADAKKRAWLIANSIVKSGGPYRTVYDAAKDKHAEAVHNEPCVRCGPSGKPALASSPLSKAHIHARGLRAVSKAVLKDLWIEAQRLHELPASGQVQCDDHPSLAAGRASDSPREGDVR